MTSERRKWVIEALRRHVDGLPNGSFKTDTLAVIDELTAASSALSRVRAQDGEGGTMTNDVRQGIGRPGAICSNCRAVVFTLCDGKCSECFLYAENASLKEQNAKLMAYFEGTENFMERLTSPPAPSGWQQRIAAMDPWEGEEDSADERCFFCHREKALATHIHGGHAPDCLWDNACDAEDVRLDGQNAKDALHPSSSPDIERAEVGQGSLPNIPNKAGMALSRACLPAPLTHAQPSGLVEGVLYCYGGCGRRYEDFGLDVILPTPLWNQIAVGPPFDETWDASREGRGGVLCAQCIMDRLAKVPGVTVAFVGVQRLGALPPVSEASPAKQLARDVAGLVPPRKSYQWTTRLYRCRSCGHETNVQSTEHRPMMCDRTNCVGRTEPVAEADASPAKETR